MRTLIAALVISLSVFSMNAYADDASRRVMAEELLQVMKAERMMKEIYEQSRSLSEKLSPPADATAAQSEMIKRFKQRLFDIVEETMSWKALKPEFITVYAGTYTEEELRAMLAFYKSPVGQSVVDKMPKATQQSTVIIQKRIPEMQRKLKALMEDMMREMKGEKEKTS